MTLRPATLHTLFPTLVYSAALQKSDSGGFNRRLLKECRQLRHDDAAGRRWSLENYAGGYTSYASVHRLQAKSPTFDALKRKLKPHVAASISWGGTQCTACICIPIRR